MHPASQSLKREPSAAPFAASRRPPRKFSAQPYWIPAGADFDAWPADLQQAVVDLVNPSYYELVSRAQAGIPRTVGLSIVHLMWLEIIDHVNLAGDGPPLNAPAAAPSVEQVMAALDGSQLPATGLSRDELIERHLRLVVTKLRACKLLSALREFKAQWPRVDSWQDEHGQRRVGDYLDGPGDPLPEYAGTRDVDPLPENPEEHGG
jgi:hypothetical protein